MFLCTPVGEQSLLVVSAKSMKKDLKKLEQRASLCTIYISPQ